MGSGGRRSRRLPHSPRKNQFLIRTSLPSERGCNAVRMKTEDIHLCQIRLWMLSGFPPVVSEEFPRSGPSFISCRSSSSSEPLAPCLLTPHCQAVGSISVHRRRLYILHIVHVQMKPTYETPAFNTHCKISLGTCVFHAEVVYCVVS